MTIMTDFTGKRILIADDYFFNQELMKDILEGFGCQVDIAQDGEEAVKKYQENVYDLIIMDISMPNKDGYMATREIRQLENNQKHIPILALTAGSGDSLERQHCLEAGMDDYISKPIVDLEALRTKISSYLKSK